MALGSRAWRSPCVNPPANFTGEQDELAGQGPIRRFNTESDEAPTKAPTPPEVPTPPFIPPSIEDLFTQFMKIFMETTQAQAQALAKPRERPLKAWTPKIYWGKSHMECYHFCQQCEDHFETFGATGMNRTPFAASFFHGSISIRWSQHKRRYESATPITWSDFKTFLRKDLRSSQAFIDSI